MSTDILYRDECYQIQGAVFNVYREMGCGFLEAVYQECLSKEFLNQNIPFSEQQRLNLFYKGMPLQQAYISDFICHDSIIVEIKALPKITPQHEAQVLNYLKATKIHLGLLVNFGSHPKATVQRLVL